MAKRTCSFCGGEKRPRDLFKANDGSYICKDCVKTLGVKVSELEVTSFKKDKEVKTPKEIKAALDEYIIKQDRAKKGLAVMMYDRSKTAVNEQIKKRNVLLLGPTGSAKTFSVETLAKVYNVPIAINTACEFTSAGYVGKDINECFLPALDACNWDVEKAERALIFFDEVDKIGRKSGKEVSRVNDVNGEGVQRALLKLMEGGKVDVCEKTGNRRHVTLDTSKMVFVFAGAFEGIEKTIEKRLKGKNVVGFGGRTIENSNETEVDKYNRFINQATVDDLAEFGLMKEFIGRIHHVIPLEKLDEKDLVRILTEPKENLVDQYKLSFSMDNIELSFEDEAYTAIAKEAIKRDTGARALSSIMEELLLDYKFEMPGDLSVKELIITEEYVKTFFSKEQTVPAKIVRRTEEEIEALTSDDGETIEL